MLFLRTSGLVAHPDRYTISGRFVIHPEHETAFFLATCALGHVLALGLTIGWNRRLWRRPPEPEPEPEPARSLGLVAVATAGAAAMATGLVAFYFGRHYVLRNLPIPPVDLVVLLLTAGAGVAVGALGAPTRFSWYPARLTFERPARRTPVGVLDAAVPLLVIAALFVPAWRALAGRVYQTEQFGHWDYFAMGPTAAFVHGAALVTQVGSQYGVGWPVLFGLLQPVLSVSYGHMILVSCLTACAYFIGVYLLLRMLSGRIAWAAAGTMLALLLQLFSGNYVYAGTHVRGAAWQFPSITVLRRPMDIWVFVFMVLHQRRQRPIHAIAAGACTGLALLFSTDTGLYLLAALLLYWVCVGIMEGSRLLGSFAASMGASVVVFLAGIGIGSRWTMFSATFWRAWYEPIAQGAAGYTALPMVGPVKLFGPQLPGPIALAAFVAIALVYLGVGCHLVIKAAHRRATSLDVILGCISAYGLLSLISFVGRSDPLELPHLLVPFAIVAAVVAARVTRTAGRPGRSAIPLLAVCVLAIALAFNPNFGDYPGLLQTIANPGPADGLCLMTAPRDVCGLPQPLTHDVQIFQAVTADMRHLARAGRVALVDFQAKYYVAADLAPWGRQVPLLPVLFEQRQLQAAMAQLLRERPAYVFIRPGAVPAYAADTAASFGDLLQRTYILDHGVGAFKVYRSR